MIATIIRDATDAWLARGGAPAWTKERLLDEVVRFLARAPRAEALALVFALGGVLKAVLERAGAPVPPEPPRPTAAPSSTATAPAVETPPEAAATAA